MQLQRESGSQTDETQCISLPGRSSVELGRSASVLDRFRKRAISSTGLRTSFLLKDEEERNLFRGCANSSAVHAPSEMVLFCKGSTWIRHMFAYNRGRRSSRSGPISPACAWATNWGAGAGAWTCKGLAKRFTARSSWNTLIRRRYTTRPEMTRDQLPELHFIAPIANVPSILTQGILSHAGVGQHQHLSIAMKEIQDRRARIVVPGTGKKLHQYANLYVCARNPMLFVRKHEAVCVLAISTDVLDLPGVIITDQNAACDLVSFRSGASGLAHVDMQRTFAEYWTDNDPLEQRRKKAAKCAEVLVPDRVDPIYILHAYVCNTEMKQHMQALRTRLEVRVNTHLFFGSQHANDQR